MDRQRGVWLFAALATLTAGAALAVALATGPSGVAQAQPGPPGTFFGTVTAADGDVAGGLNVVAYIDDIVCSEEDTPQTLRENGVTSYRVEVLSADARAGCGVAAVEVRFRIGDRYADETGSWLAEPQELNLTLQAPPPEPVEPTETPSDPGEPEEPTEPEEPGEPEEPTEPEEPGEPEEPTEPTETVEPTDTEEPTETVEPADTEEPTETPESEETTEETPVPTEAVEATEVATATPTPAPTPTAAATPVATEPPAATEPAAATEAPTPAATDTPAPPAPDETEETGGGTGAGTTALIVVLSVVAGLAAISTVFFLWMARSPATGGGVAGGNETRSGQFAAMGSGARDRLTTLWDSIRSRIQRP